MNKQYQDWSFWLRGLWSHLIVLMPAMPDQWICNVAALVFDASVCVVAFRLLRRDTPPQPRRPWSRWSLRRMMMMKMVRLWNCICDNISLFFKETSVTASYYFEYPHVCCGCIWWKKYSQDIELIARVVMSHYKSSASQLMPTNAGLEDLEGGCIGVWCICMYCGFQTLEEITPPQQLQS